MIDVMHEAEELGRGLPLAERLDRRWVVRVGVNGFFNWAEDTMRRISSKAALADAINYAVKRREVLTRLCDDARLKADNNRAENCLRPVALGRKNYLFAGSDKGGERAAAIYTLIQTARLNFVDPEARLRDVLTRIVDGHPATRVGAVMLEHWSEPISFSSG
ncbi:transposase [Sphingomonas sp.]|uniref:IS66 family transposase n=1 Tax=Sphingomonas sp. TaxID=28214 RepID=UPI0035C7C9FA